MPRFSVAARFSAGFLLVLALGLAACSDDATGPGTQGFQLQVQVTGSSGDPVSGLRVSAWSLIPAQITQDGKRAANPAWATRPARAVTVFPFTLAEAATVTYALFDANDRLVCTLIDQALPAGSHALQWNGMLCDLDPPEAAFSGTYRAMFTARDSDSGEIIQTDGILAVLYLSDPDQQILGFTDRAGRFVTEDRNFFPHLFEWPPFVWTDETGEVLGTFAYTGSVRIALYNASTQQTQFQDFAVGKGENDLRITWDPGKMAHMAASAGASSAGSAGGSMAASAPEPVAGSAATQIRQNYPNPFN